MRREKEGGEIFFKGEIIVKLLPRAGGVLPYCPSNADGGSGGWVAEWLVR